MVLTNFECWAHGEPAPANFETGSPTRHSPMVDPFSARAVSHIATASNGYYGYAIVNNAVAASDNNNNNCNNNNIQAQPMQMQTNDIAASASAAAAAAAAAARCKKRCFTMEMDNLTAVKRCRFDDADLVAQYCSDFFSLPSTQIIGTQACLMDYESDAQPQQQQQQHDHQQQQQQQQQETPQPQQMLHPRIHQHYQGHLHRANRDVSRCMMSHMI